jgi:hypothetical protein
MFKEPEKQRQDFLNDATDAVGAVFLGMTLGCARCHEHKYDAISHHDYLAMQAFFGGANRETREMKVKMAEPDFVTTEFQNDKTEPSRPRAEREALLADALDVLENDRATLPAKNKPSEDKEKKRAGSTASAILLVKTLECPPDLDPIVMRYFVSMILG